MSGQPASDPLRARGHTMLNDPRSHGLWEKTAPAAPQTAPLQGAAKADVVIVGGLVNVFEGANVEPNFSSER